MNILFILPEYYPHSGGGISTYYLHYIKALKPYCEKIKIIVGSGYVQHNEEHVIDGIEVEYLKPGIYKQYLNHFSKFDLFPELKKSIAAAWAMFEQAGKGEGFDIIECTDFGLGFIPWVIKHNKPVVTRLHGSTGQVHLHETDQPSNIGIDFVRQTELLLLPVCDRLITHSKANQDFWKKTQNKSVIKIDPVFNTDIQQPLPLASRENTGLVTARVQEWKGPVQLCEALATLNASEVPQIKWFGRDMPYIGHDSMAGFLQSKFPSVWNKRIIPHKPLDNEHIRALQQKAKFGVVPSTWDMFNFTCLEFLGAGTPVICSDGAGCSDLIEHGKNGFKYPAMNIQALAECLWQLNRMKESEYNKMAAAGLETVNTRLSAAHLIPLNTEQYEAVIKGFEPNQPNTFLDAIYCPSDDKHHIRDILDKLPLKSLMTYILNRAKGKMKIN